MPRSFLPCSLLTLWACSGGGGGGGGAPQSSWSVLGGGSDGADGGDGTDGSDGTDGTDGGDSGDTGVIDPSLACAELGLPVRPWEDAVDDDTLYATAADLTLPTREGDWSLAAEYSGCDSYLFIQQRPRQNTGFDTGSWERDHDDLFDLLPENVHLFFIPDSGNEEARATALDELQANIEDELERMDSAQAEAWRGRVHYVTARDTDLPGWLGETMKSPAWGVAIDRTQRIRYIGSYADPKRYDEAVGWFQPNLGMVANEAIYYNFEANREAALAADGATVVTVFDGQQGGDVTVDVTLPDAATLSEMDKLQVDLTMACIGEGEYGTCPAWDYMAYLYLCDEPSDTVNPYADTACAAGDTLEGACRSPIGEERAGTYTCKEDGSGYDDLACGGCDTEIGRWITTYHREGRWVYDISPMLPLLAGGGHKRLRFQSDNSYDLTGSLRFSNTGDALKPKAVDYVLGDVNTDTFLVPATAKRVTLATVISQHGQTCGEFCNAEHHFVINDNLAGEYVRDFPTTSTYYGCMDQVAVGTVPNQYGTWWYGRSGWCPGLQVDTVTTDITDQVVLGGENTITYTVEGDAGTVRRRFWILTSE